MNKQESGLEIVIFREKTGNAQLADLATLRQSNCLINSRQGNLNIIQGRPDTIQQYASTITEQENLLMVDIFDYTICFQYSGI